MSTTRTIQILVKPNARESSLTENPGCQPWCARLKSPPTDGKANTELIALLAAHLHCPKSSITLKSGASSRIKYLLIPAA